MAKLTYPGPLEAVSIPSLGLTVKRGGSADVPDEAAPQLLDQGWLSGDDMPSTVEEVKAWVGDDPERAALALAAEEAGKDRKTLVEWLTGLIDANPANQATNEGA